MVKKRGYVRGDAFVNLFGRATWERHRPALIAEKAIIASGMGRAMTYRLPTKVDKDEDQGAGE